MSSVVKTFTLPDIGEGLTEAQVVAVLVAPGDVVKMMEPLVTVETDKAEVDLPSPWAGRVEAVLVEPGQWIEVGAGIVQIAQD